MPATLSTARKYRPERFGDVVGQDHITIPLRNAVRSGQIPQSLLFAGPRGVGKTTCARILARALNCLNLTEEGEPCGECESCREFQEGRSVSIFELDAASNNSVDHIRNLVEHVRYPPARRYKVYIIDEAHMLSQSAFNAFLKTLEEPPEYAVFVLATTEKFRILPTILSRCQIYDFRRIPPAEMVQRLQYVCQQEQIEAEDKALYEIAVRAEGSLRDALTLLDRLRMYTAGRRITYQDVVNTLHLLHVDTLFHLTEQCIAGDVPGLMDHLRTLLQEGYDGYEILVGMIRHLRILLHAHLNAESLQKEMSEDVLRRYQHLARRIPPSYLLSALLLLMRYEMEYRFAADRHVLVEIALMELATLPHLMGRGSVPVSSPASNTPSGTKELSGPPAIHTQKKTTEVQVSHTRGNTWFPTAWTTRQPELAEFVRLLGFQPLSP